MKSFFEKLTKSNHDNAEESVDLPKKEKVIHFRKEALKELGNEKEETKRHRSKKDTESSSPLPQKSLDDKEEGQLTVDVYQTDTEIVIKSTIAGIKPEELDINITSDMVTIRGTREHEEKVSKDNYFYQECYWGRFSRSIILPQDIVAEKSEAAMKNGVLTIRLPKAHVVTSKKLRVKLG